MKKILFALIFGIMSLNAFASFPAKKSGSSVKTEITTSETSSALDYLLYSDDEMLIAVLLCIFLGSFGVHWFYLGEKAKGKRRLFTFLASVALAYGGIFTLYAGLISGGVFSLLGLGMYYAGIIGLVINWVMTIVDLINIVSD